MICMVSMSVKKKRKEKKKRCLEEDLLSAKMTTEIVIGVSFCIFGVAGLIFYFTKAKEM